MKRCTIVRQKTDAPQTFGVFYVGNTRICDTLEPTKLKMDCGFFLCVPHGWEPESKFTHKQTWALVGTNVSHQPENGVTHYGVLFHEGNWVKDSKACILPGTRGLLEGKPAVASSKTAMDKLRTILGNSAFYLTIREE